MESPEILASNFSIDTNRSTTPSTKQVGSESVPSSFMKLGSKLFLLAASLVVGSAAHAQTVLVSNLATTNGSNNQVDSGFWRSQAFDMGSASFNLSSVEIRGFQNSSGGTVAIFSNTGTGFNNGSDKPNTLLSTLTGSIPVGGSASTTFTLTPASAVTLASNTRYWIVWEASDNSHWFSPSNGTTSGADASIPSSMGLRFSGNHGSSWTIGSNETMEIGISGVSAIPEPSTYAAMAGAAALGLAAWTRKRRTTLANS